MIASVSGSIQVLEKDALVISVGGVGIRVKVPQTVLENSGGVGRNIFLHTHFIVRETELALYGFESTDDLRIFNTLIGINGIGPKVGLSILSTISPELLRTAVIQDEAVILQRVPGIGKKSAEKIIFALRGKLDNVDAASVGLVSDIDTDVIDVLTTLGFSIIESQAALQKVPRDISDINERVAAALQQLDQG